MLIVADDEFGSAGESALQNPVIIGVFFNYSDLFFWLYKMGEIRHRVYDTLNFLLCQ